MTKNINCLSKKFSIFASLLNPTDKTSVLLIALIFTDSLTCTEENCSNDLNFQRIYLSRERDFSSVWSRLKISPESHRLLLGQSPQPKSKQKRNDFKNKRKIEKCAGRWKNFLILTFGATKKVWKFLQRHCWCLFVLLACINKTIIRRRWVIREIYSMSFGDRRKRK